MNNSRFKAAYCKLLKSVLELLECDEPIEPKATLAKVTLVVKVKDKDTN